LLAAARQKGFRGIVTTRGADALELVERFKPAAITLALGLADIDGWSVLEQFKRNFATRHIPVQIISADDDRARGLRYGAFDYLVKPVTADEIQDALVGVVEFAQRKTRNLLVIEGDEGYRARILALVGNGDVQIENTGSGGEALKMLSKKRYDCVVLNLKLPDISGIHFLEALQKSDSIREVPIVVCGTETLARPEQERFRTLVGKSVIKEVQSPERMVDETALFLHRVVFELSQ